MFASSLEPRGRRRGIVLVLVLGMLALLALIGVTFATFAGQSLINGRNFNQGVARPQPEVLMDFALGQLINDTNNPLSALRGHSLLRDMYGNDSLFRGSSPNNNPAADTGGLFYRFQTAGGYSPLQMQNAYQHTTTSTTPFFNQQQYVTNIPTSGQYNGLDFTRWIIRMGFDPTRIVNGAFVPVANNNSNTNLLPTATIEVPQTFEILEDINDPTLTPVHIFTLSNNLANPTVDPTYNINTNSTIFPVSASDWTSFIYSDANMGALVSTSGNPTPATTVSKNFSQLARELNTNVANGTQGTLGSATGSVLSNAFVLDGRYMRAFNGAGMTRFLGTPNSSLNGGFNIYPYNAAAFANFRVTGANPDAIGMDEDYDACDLENWFLAIQSADGQVMIPSFHRPGILTADDWTKDGGSGNPKILRPRQIDHSPLFPGDPSALDSTTFKLTYDVDNDGDGVTDSVWLDLGYPTQRDPGGKLYKPLFAFMVLGLNGRLPLNTAGNLQSRAIGDTSRNNMNGALPNSVGQVYYPGAYTYNSTFPDYYPLYSSTTYLDAPTWDHTSHLGFSVNEINPKYALQNAPSNLYPPYPNSTPQPDGGYTKADLSNVVSYSQYDTAGVNVALTQMRNILAGTIPTDIPIGSVASGSGAASSLPMANTNNGDCNWVFVNYKPYVLPNNVADPADLFTSTAGNQGGAVGRGGLAVPGRWGEPQGVPHYLNAAGTGEFSLLNNSRPILWYNNPVRAGNSAYGAGISAPFNYSGQQFTAQNITGTNDVLDDDFDATDPYLPSRYQIGDSSSPTAFSVVQTLSSTPGGPPSGDQYTIPLNSAVPFTAHNFGSAVNTVQLTGRDYPEFVDSFDPAGQTSVPAERIRKYTTPTDPAGVGRLVAFPSANSHRPTNDHDYGLGFDSKGRNGFFRYFRPAGMPQEVRYPYGGPTYVGSSFPYTYTPGSGTGQQFLMPVLVPSGYAAATPGSRNDTHTNRFHGYQSMILPDLDPGVTFTFTGTTPSTATATSAPFVMAWMGAMPFDWNSTAGTMKEGDWPAGYGTSINLLAPTINPFVAQAPPYGSYTNNAPIFTAVNTENGPNLGSVADASALPAPNYVYPTGYLTQNSAAPYNAAGVVNGYLGGSLNKDEADEMNLYGPNRADMPFAASDLEWLYRKQDVDGSTLNSRLSQLAPVSFLNPADGLTRRRMFSTDVWDLNTFSWANDNPSPYAGVGYSLALAGTTYSYANDHDFTYNSRFAANASPSLEIMNQVVTSVQPILSGGPPVIYGSPSSTPTAPYYQFANFITTEFLPNPTFPAQGVYPGAPSTHFGNTIHAVMPNSNYIGAMPTAPIGFPLNIDPTNPNTNASPTAIFDPATVPFQLASANTNLPIPIINSLATPSMAQVQTPSIAHRDRKINLNFPLPTSADPGEPIRQKWVRETYQMMKAILPPASIDTPEELAALSQFVVNIIDFRDTDCTSTRFVNTDLVVTDVLTRSAASNTQTNPLDLTWTLTPSGVKYADISIPGNHYPYDPSLYSPDAVSPFLVQHGMEYSPIAINEAVAYQATVSGNNYQAMFIELVNMLTVDQNGTTTQSASDVSIGGWDIVVVPDAYGWGRPDSITGDVNPVAFPPLNSIPLTMGGDPTKPPILNGVKSQRPFTDPATGLPKPPPSGPVDTNLAALQLAVQQYSFQGTGSTNRVPAMTGSTVNYFVIGDYQTPATPSPPPPPAVPQPQPQPILDNTFTTYETSPIVMQFSKLTTPTPTGKPAGARLSDPGYTPASPPGAPYVPPKCWMSLPNVVANGEYYWVYLRRPANPYDDQQANQVRPNKEMVVVDSMRFAAFNDPAGGTFYSTQRLQPFRGGHLVPYATKPGPKTVPPTDPANPAVKNTTICPPIPISAYGYSEQSYPAQSSDSTATIKSTPTATVNHTIKAGTTPTSIDGNFSSPPIHDRDFASVAELLLVPGCPPGLFTKQFVEESYPGNIFYDTSLTVPAQGLDDSAFVPNPLGDPAPKGALLMGSKIQNPVGLGHPSFVGRQNFSGAATPPTPANLTFPYLPDNFYYTAASVAPPPAPAKGSLDPGYTQLTTEVGGWTGNGWHKMLEFFEVPSSANGAVGTADNGNNFDWARADIKPGQINLNLIVDEEVFAGLIDDPRMNEHLALWTSAIPYVVNQIDASGYPTHDATTGAVHGRTPMFSQSSNNYGDGTNLANGGLPNPGVYGRGYVYRDPNVVNYNAMLAPNYPYQQVHGIKAAFSDFLKLRHGGSGHLFGFGAGPVGSGDFLLSLTLPKGTPVTQPIAAERPFRSLSYPDINYTILRPASLPPSPNDTLINYTDPNGNVITTPNFVGTNPALPLDLAPIINGTTSTLGMYQYQSSTVTPTLAPHIGLNPELAPFHKTPPGSTTATALDYQYLQDPGIKNPYLPIQYVNQSAPTTAATRQLGPPYAVQPPPPASPTVAAPTPAAPFPPSIPPTPSRRLLQIPDQGSIPTPPSSSYSSNASLNGQSDGVFFMTNQLTIPRQLSILPVAGVSPPSLVDQSRAVFSQDYTTPQVNTTTNHFLGANINSAATTTDLRQHPTFRTEWLQKISNLTTVRTHQFATWITIGFFEVAKVGTPELNIPDVLGQELNVAKGTSVRYRSFFVIDRTKATGFNPYYPGNFRDCVTYRRRIE